MEDSMQQVGIRELKNRLTHYPCLLKERFKVINPQEFMPTGSVKP
jgi:hypothetical protein